MKVLVVDDDPLARAEISAALTRTSWDLKQDLERRKVTFRPLAAGDIAEANSRDQAINQLASKKFDLVFLDLLLPPTGEAPSPPPKELLGYGILKFARSLRPPPKVIVFSANVRSGEPGLQQFEELLTATGPLPDELLWKDAYPYLETLQRKIVSYLVDPEPDKEILRRDGIFFDSHGETGQLLRRLKRAQWFGEPGRPMPDVVLRGERGVGKATLARAFHLLRFDHLSQTPTRRLGFEHIDARAIQRGPGDLLAALCGTSGDVWRLGSLTRATHYMRDERWMRMPGQVVEEVSADARRREVIGGEANERLYPRSGDGVDFDASGTVYLEDAFGEPLSEAEEEIERILGPDLDQRFVTTRGPLPLRLRVGPSVVLGFTINSPETAPPQPGMRRRPGFSPESLDPVEMGSEGMEKPHELHEAREVIEVTPLRHRSTDEKVFLLELLVNLRHRRNEMMQASPSDPLGFRGAVRLDENMRDIVGSDLYYRHNLDDLQAIGNQVRREEQTITWGHLRWLWERDKELAKVWRRGRSP
jgi:CheY-like chemotaxis protein